MTCFFVTVFASLYFWRLPGLNRRGNLLHNLLTKRGYSRDQETYKKAGFKPDTFKAMLRRPREILSVLIWNGDILWAAKEVQIHKFFFKIVLPYHF
ncbi:hypothetical protein PNOK_0281700 [Pyrrhoderma noxium]|uniref:Uncharacterized protein n=1 Tax=Pyrrhoderma noxium TaxID=2282107 RepID=A0A286UTD4_9AGAM|nr:hypothetical protein PNOK_0281700 [Pyrrhoderma noxium]